MSTEHGRIIISDPGSDVPIAQYSTLQCCHCGCHMIIRPGSGTKRGWCGGCNGPTCSPNCEKACVPIELWLENVEKGRPEDYRPIHSAVPIQLT